MNSRHLTTSTSRLALLTAMLLLLSNSHALGQAGTAAQGCQPLPASSGTERSISGGERHCFKFELQPDELFQASVEQKGVKLRLRLLDADGKELAQANSPNDKEGRKVLTHVAAAAGSYTLEVGLLEAQGGGGTYTVRREAARPPTPQDRRRAEVERLWAEAEAARQGNAPRALIIEKLLAAEAGWRELGDAHMAEVAARRAKRTRAVDLFHSGHTTFRTSKTPESLKAAEEKLREAKRLFSEVEDKYGEAGSLVGLATIAYFKGEKRAAVDGYRQALPLFAAVRSRGDEAAMWYSIASVSLELGDHRSALEQMLQALPIRRELGHDPHVAAIENDVGSIYYLFGDYKTALEYLERALDAKRKFNDACSLATTLTNIGIVYMALGEKARALNFLAEQALPLYPADNKCAERAVTLTDIGRVYYDLGEYNLALKHHDDALRFQLASGDKLKANEADIRANIGVTYYGTRDYAKALASFNEALTISRNLRDRRREAALLTNVGVVETAQGKYAGALGTFRKALALHAEVGDRNGEANTLNNIGENYLASGEGAKALEYFKQSLPLFMAAGDRSGEAVALGNAMVVSRRLGNRRMAIFYGKQSVNNFQELRGAARVRDHEIQRNYLRIIRGAYEELTEALMEEGLYEQAVQVLNLYQDQQFFDFDRAAASTGRVEPTARERELLGRFRAAAEAVGTPSARVEDLLRQSAVRELSSEESARLSQLRKELEMAKGVSLALLEEVEAEFARPPDAKDQPESATDVSDMRRALNALNAKPRQRSVALYTLVGAERFYVLLVTPDGLEAFTSPSKAAAVNASVVRLYDFLKQPAFPAQKASAALYDIIFKATSTRRAGVTLEAELGRRSPDVLLWSLNGALNYISVAALYDEGRRQYLIEKYQNAVFTRGDGERLLRESRAWTSGVGFGKAGASRFTCEEGESPRAAPRLGALDFVPQELSTIFRGARGLPPLVPGRVVLDDDFKLGELDGLKGKNVPLVHISSHFCLRSGDAENSFLLLGDDTKLTLFEMAKRRGLFEGVDLLVLSACRSAALQPSSKTGREVDSLAELSQRLGASSVIATLWDTTDEGAGRLMIEFYRLRAKSPESSKAELLRRAQLSLLRGETKQPGVDLKHPSYWSAFVLYGSFR